jgi:hypothetical protein
VFKAKHKVDDTKQPESALRQRDIQKFKSSFIKTSKIILPKFLKNSRGLKDVFGR